MKQVKVMRYSKWYVVDTGDNKIHMISKLALKHHLKNMFGMSSAEANNTIEVIDDVTVIYFDWDTKRIA